MRDLSNDTLTKRDTLYTDDSRDNHQMRHPPKNGVIALWPNTRVVKCKYYVSQKQNGFNNKIHWYSILLTFIHKFTAEALGLEYVYSVISVIDNSLPGSTKK